MKLRRPMDHAAVDPVNESMDLFRGVSFRKINLKTFSKTFLHLDPWVFCKSFLDPIFSFIKIILNLFI
jgi:hypothetical protein